MAWRGLRGAWGGDGEAGRAQEGPQEKEKRRSCGPTALGRASPERPWAPKERPHSLPHAFAARLLCKGNDRNTEGS